MDFRACRTSGIETLVGATQKHVGPRQVSEGATKLRHTPLVRTKYGALLSGTSLGKEWELSTGR